MHIGFQQQQQLPSVTNIILFQQLQKIIINETKKKQILKHSLIDWWYKHQSFIHMKLTNQTTSWNEERALE